MTPKQLKIISAILAGIGIYFISSTVYRSFQFGQPLADFESFVIALLGVVIQIPWYLPFFIFSYWLYKATKDDGPVRVTKLLILGIVYVIVEIGIILSIFAINIVMWMV